MIYGKKVEFSEVLAEWVRREYDKRKRNGKVPHWFEESLLDDNDYSDPIKNGKRLGFLGYRSVLIGTIPLDTEWFKVDVEKEDLKSVYIIKEMYWGFLTKNTGKISDAVKYFRKYYDDPSSIPKITDPKQEKFFKELIGRIGEFRKRTINSLSQLNLNLILIASSKEGPFTLLEGNKTALGLYLRYFIDEPNVDFQPFSSYVGISPAMNYCYWHYPSDF